MPSDRIEFMRRLAVIAGLTNFPLTDGINAVYTEAFQGAYVDAGAALWKLLPRMKPGRFPSIDDIREAMGIASQNDEQLAREAAARIPTALLKFGYAQPTKAREFMGDLAWHVVELSGGWGYISDLLTHDNTPTLLAQWRELAEGQLIKARNGELHKAPALPESTRPPSLAAALKIALEGQPHD